jgi:hypothetical protein
MAVLKITPFDTLTQRLRIVLEQIAECDDPEEAFLELRRKYHVDLDQILADAALAGYTETELYGHVIAMEGARVLNADA